jgi:hypothetical protein
MPYHFSLSQSLSLSASSSLSSPSSSIIVHVDTNAKKAYEADYRKGFFGWPTMIMTMMMGCVEGDDDG